MVDGAMFDVVALENIVEVDGVMVGVGFVVEPGKTLRRKELAGLGTAPGTKACYGVASTGHAKVGTIINHARQSRIE
jgi:hypothetical protein